MQAPTHALVGIFLQVMVFTLLPQDFFLLQVFSTILLCFFSHFILDGMAKITYHPPDPLPEDRFWVGYHFFLLTSSITLYSFLLPWFWLGIISANAVDIWDWLIIRKIANKKGNPDWGKRFRFHPLADVVRRRLFFFLPDLTRVKIGAFPEITLILLMHLIIVIAAMNSTF
ncbi:MAG: hypothetical protein ACTSP4_05970 [Candidatus Hodarchaeales archaeon]